MVSGKLKEIILLDFCDCLEYIDAPLRDDVKDVLYPQTILGHAHELHRNFIGLKKSLQEYQKKRVEGKRFNQKGYDKVLNLIKESQSLTQEDIILTLGMNPSEHREKREHLIYEIKDCLTALLNDENNLLVNKKGEPLLGAEFLKYYPIKICKDTFRGAALAARMDSGFWREKTLQMFPKNLKGENWALGYGDEYPVDLKMLYDHGLTERDLADKPHSLEEIMNYTALKIIIDSEKPIQNAQNLFIRRKVGPGGCDDGCLLTIGKYYGVDAMLLAFLVDAADTYGKFLKNGIRGGHDGMLGDLVEKKFDKKLLNEYETCRVIYLGAKNNFPQIDFSSSHRRFCQIESGQNLPTILNHYYYLQEGIRPRRYKLGANQVSTTYFYNSMETRWNLFENSFASKTDFKNLKN